MVCSSFIFICTLVRNLYVAGRNLFVRKGYGIVWRLYVFIWKLHGSVRKGLCRQVPRLCLGSVWTGRGGRQTLRPSRWALLWDQSLPKLHRIKFHCCMLVGFLRKLVAFLLAIGYLLRWTCLVVCFCSTCFLFLGLRLWIPGLLPQALILFCPGLLENTLSSGGNAAPLVRVAASGVS